MADIPFIPMDDVKNYNHSSFLDKPKVDQYHILLGSEEMVFTKSLTGNPAKFWLPVTNIGWDDMPLHKIDVVGKFQINGTLPTVLLTGKTYTFEVEFTPDIAGEFDGALNFRVGNSYGSKFVRLKGTSVA